MTAASQLRARNAAERLYARRASHYAALATVLASQRRHEDAEVVRWASALCTRALEAERRDPDPKER